MQRTRARGRHAVDEAFERGCGDDRQHQNRIGAEADVPGGENQQSKRRQAVPPRALPGKRESGDGAEREQNGARVRAPGHGAEFVDRVHIEDPDMEAEVAEDPGADGCRQQRGGGKQSGQCKT